MGNNETLWRFLSCQPEIESIESPENTGGLVWLFQSACINHNETSIHWITWFNSNIILTWKKSLSWFAHETTMHHPPICRLVQHLSKKKQGLSNYQNYPIQIAHWFIFTVRSRENQGPLGGPLMGSSLKVVLWLMCIYFTKLLPASLLETLFVPGKRVTFGQTFWSKWHVQSTQTSRFGDNARPVTPQTTL